MNHEIEPAVIHLVEVSSKLRCSMGTTARALILYHQFMRCVAEAEYDTNMVAASALLLSGMINESAVDLDDVIHGFYHAVNKEENSSAIDDSTYALLRKSVVTVHYLMQRMFEFNMNHRLPHQYLVAFLSVISESREVAYFHEEISATCLKLLNDFFTCRKCVDYKAEDIALTCIDIAVSIHGLRNDVIEHWYQGLSDDFNADKMKEIKEAIFDVYTTDPNEIPEQGLLDHQIKCEN